MDLQADAAVWADGEFDAAWLRQRIALPPQFPLPLPAGRVAARLTAQVASDGTASLEVRVDWRLAAPLRLFGGLAEVGPALRLTLTAGFTSATELAAARDAWYAPAPASPLAGTVDCELRLRLAPVPPAGPLTLHLGDTDGWIALHLAIAAGTGGASFTVEAGPLGELALQMPGLPLADAPLRLSLESAQGELQVAGDRWEGELALAGRFRFAPRIDPGGVELLALLAPLLDGIELGGTLACTLTLAAQPSLLLRGEFDESEVGLDVFALLRTLGQGLAAPQPMGALDLDLSSRSQLGFRFAGIALRLGEEPAFALEVAAQLAGLVLPAHLELSLQEFRAGLGHSRLALQASPPLELPLCVPHVTAADLGYAGGVAAARTRPGAKPADQWIWERVGSGRRADYDAAVQQLVDAVESLTGAASGASGVVVARLGAGGWELLLRDPAIEPDPDQPLVVGLAAVHEPDAAGQWRPSGELAIVARIDGRWSVLLAMPRLRFVDFHLAVDLRNPRNTRIGGVVGFAWRDSAAQQQVIEAEAEISADAIYFSVRQVDSPPIRLGEIEIRIGRLLFGFGYSKRSLAFAFAGELALPESLVDLLDTSDEVGVGVRLPVQSKLEFKFELVPLTLGQIVIPIPLFQFDWDGRRKTSLALQDTRICEPFWDGAQLIVDGVARIGLKKLSFNPILTFFACANSDFDGDLALGDADTGLTVVGDNFFWAYGQDSWTANLLTPVNVVPFCDNFCVGLRGAGFRLNFNLQRPVPAFSPLAVFELIALLVDPEHYQVAPRGALADSVRISITDAYLVLPARVRRLFPAADGLVGKTLDKTINLADYIALLQGGIAQGRRLVGAALQARDDLATLPQRLRAQAAALQDGGLGALLGDLLAHLPAELRSTRLDASFAGFDGAAVLVLTERSRAAAELAARAEPGSPFGAGEFADFGPDDLAAVDWPTQAAPLRPAELRPELLQAVRSGRGSAGKALRRGLDAALRAEIDAWDGTLIDAPLRERLAAGLNTVLAGAGGAKTLLPRTQARQLGLTGRAAELAERSAATLGAEELLQLNRTLLEKALPEAAPTALAMLVGARLRVAGTQVLGFFGSLASDGRFMAVTSLALPALQLPVAGLTVPLPLSVDGRLTLRGRAGPLGVEGLVEAAVRADWSPLPGMARLTLGSAARPATLQLRSDTRFRVQGEGVLALHGERARLQGEIDIAETHARARGELALKVENLFEIELAAEGAVGPGTQIVLAGAGSAKLLGMPLAEVEGRLDERRLAVAARLALVAWKPPGRAALPVEIDLRLAGGVEFTRPAPNLSLAGSGTLALFGARIADGRAGVDLQHGKNGQPELLTWIEGRLRWHGRDWLGARIELGTKHCRVRGRTALNFDVTPPGLPFGLLLALEVEGSIGLTVPAGALDTLALQGQWWLGVRQAGGHVAPIAVGELPPLAPADLPRVLLSLPGFALPRLDAALPLPLPTLQPTGPVTIQWPTQVTLPSLHPSTDTKAANLFDLSNLAAALGVQTFTFMTGVNYNPPTPGGSSSEPVVSLGGFTTPLSLPTGFEVVWPGDGRLPLPFDLHDGFTLALDWDADEKRLVLVAGPRGPAPKLEVVFDPPGADIDAEFVAIVNDSTKPLVLTGWSLHDGADRARRYVFPARTLAPGETLRLWSGQGSDDALNLFWGRAQAVWNNRGGDTAVLLDEHGIERVRLAVGSAARGG
ncbi:MAG: lamin tail domain-containing protein [Piscinibacter sp.]|nr:lamin tail domain-containing protein [Piscinibacter sp.]